MGSGERVSSRIGMMMVLLFRALTVRKTRVLIALTSVAVGAAVVTALASLYFDISLKMSKELRTYGANFFVGADVSQSARTLPRRVYDQILARVPAGRLSGASPYLYGVVRLDLGNAVLVGVDFSGLRKLSPFWQVQGSWIGVDFDERHCMVGKNLAAAMELNVGDAVNVVNRENGFQAKLAVKGIVESGQAADDHIFVNLSLAQKTLGHETPIAEGGRINHGMLSIVADGMDIDTFAGELAAEFPQLAARPIRRIAHSEGKILGRIEGLMALVAGIILVITTLCVNTTLSAMVLERRREIGLQKALGADNRRIVIQFLTETGLIGLVGVAGGLVIGFGLAQVFGQAVFGAAVSFRPVVLPLTVLIILVAALAAAAVPIRTAVDVMPADVLRGE